MNPTEDVLRALPGHLSRNQRNDGRGQSSPVSSHSFNRKSGIISSQKRLEVVVVAREYVFQAD